MGMGTKLKGLLGAIAPTIASAVGGPLGGVAMKFLADKFTDGDTGSVEDFLLSAEPEKLAELKLADIQFKRDMAKVGVDLEEIAFKDRDSARDLAKVKGILPQVILAAVFIGGYFWLIYLFMTSDMIEGLSDFAKGQLGILIGVLTAGIGQIMNFFFGSSTGSKEKTAAMAANPRT